MTGTIDEGNVSKEMHFAAAARTFAGGIGFFVRGVGFIAAWTGTGFIVAFINLSLEKKHPFYIYFFGVILEGRVPLRLRSPV